MQLEYTFKGRSSAAIFVLVWALRIAALIFIIHSAVIVVSGVSKYGIAHYVNCLQNGEVSCKKDKDFMDKEIANYKDSEK